MTDEELDKARAEEALRLKDEMAARRTPYPSWVTRVETFGDIQLVTAGIAARLAREGWKPEDPLLKEARHLIVSMMDDHAICWPASADGCTRFGKFGVDLGQADDTDVLRIALVALKRGMELAKEMK